MKHKHDSASGGDMEQAWARQLHREFAQICYQHSLQLVPPVIELFASGHRLGTWQRSSRTIAINRRLITEHGWDTVILVLKHEMAHQLCDEVLGGGETAHDLQFRRACEMLGLPPRWAKARIDLEILDANGGQDGLHDGGRSKVIDKVRKVLALAHSANEHEARLALETAARLMRRHALERGDIDFQEEDVACTIVSLGKSRVGQHQRLIASLLSRYFGVRLICSRLYDAAADRSCRTFEIFGTRENVAVAEHCYHFLESRLGALWREYRTACPDSCGRSKGSYYCGVLHGFAETLQQGCCGQPPSREERSGPGGRKGDGLPAVVEQRIAACIRRRHPRLHTVTGRKTRVDRELFESGIVAGRGIKLRSAVGEADGGWAGPRLLGTTSSE